MLGDYRTPTSSLWADAASEPCHTRVQHFGSAASPGRSMARVRLPRDPVANDQFFILAVAVVYDHAFEENFAAADAQLNGAEPPVVMPDEISS